MGDLQASPELGEVIQSLNQVRWSKETGQTCRIAAIADHNTIYNAEDELNGSGLIKQICNLSVLQPY